MNVVFTILGVLALLGGIGCSIVILIDAFQDAVWKGLVSLLCGLYFLYYALAEFEHDNKWLIVLGALCGSGVGSALLGLGAR